MAWFIDLFAFVWVGFLLALPYRHAGHTGSGHVSTSFRRTPFLAVGGAIANCIFTVHVERARVCHAIKLRHDGKDVGCVPRRVRLFVLLV
jgi:hypothetical protein